MELNDILAKIEHFCLYQERTEKEVRNKLETFNLTNNEIQSFISNLKTNRFVDDDRYTKLYIQNKIPRGWGKIKIKHYLSLKGVDTKIIEKQIDEIVNQEEYVENLRRVLKKKSVYSKSLDRENYAKLFKFLLNKGYESELITEEMKKI